MNCKSVEFESRPSVNTFHRWPFFMRAFADGEVEHHRQRSRSEILNSFRTVLLWFAVMFMPFFLLQKLLSIVVLLKQIFVTKSSGNLLTHSELLITGS